MDGIDPQAKLTIIPWDRALISEKLRDKGGQGTRPQYYAQQQNQPEPPPEEEETPEEQGTEKHLIDIKV